MSTINEKYPLGKMQSNASCPLANPPSPTRMSNLCLPSHLRAWRTILGGPIKYSLVSPVVLLVAFFGVFQNTQEWESEGSWHKGQSDGQGHGQPLEP